MKIDEVKAAIEAASETTRNLSALDAALARICNELAIQNRNGEVWLDVVARYRAKLCSELEGKAKRIAELAK